MLKNKVNLLVTLSLMLIICLGCISFKAHYYKDDIKLAEIEAEKIISRINSKSIDKLYDNSHPLAFENKSKEKLSELIDKLHSTFGKINKTHLAYSKAKTASVNERMVVLLYRCEFDKGENVLILEIVTNDTEAKFYGFSLTELSQLETIKKELESK